MLRLRLYASLALAAAVATPARALLTFDQGKDKVLVNATYSFGYDTNIFARSVAKGAVTQAYSASAVYTRRAGIISVSAVTSISHTIYAGLPGEDFYSPNLSLTFAKGTGRTTGALSFTGSRATTPDPIANNRATALNLGVGLNLRYPVIERYYFTNAAGFSTAHYTNKALFSDLNTYSDDIALNYKYDSKLDLNTAYRFGLNRTKGIEGLDNALLVGAVGTLRPKLSGTIDVGYDVRQNDYLQHQGKSQQFRGLTADLALNWRTTRTLGFTFTGSKAYSISSTDITTNTTTAGVSTDLAIGKRLRTTFGVTYVGTAFLGPNSKGRRDTLIEVPVNLGTALTTHIDVNLAYAYMINYSNISTGKFIRETITLSITAKY